MALEAIGFGGAYASSIDEPKWVISVIARQRRIFFSENTAGNLQTTTAWGGILRCEELDNHPDSSLRLHTIADLTIARSVTQTKRRNLFLPPEEWSCHLVRGDRFVPRMYSVQIALPHSVVNVGPFCRKGSSACRKAKPVCSRPHDIASVPRLTCTQVAASREVLLGKEDLQKTAPRHEGATEIRDCALMYDHIVAEH
jgi:hypothetical protein